MVGAHRTSTTAAIVVCVLIAQSTTSLLASEAPAPETSFASSASTNEAVEPTSPTTELTPVSPRARLTLDAVPLGTLASLDSALSADSHPFRLPPPEFAASAGQIYRGAPYPYRHRHDVSLAAIMIGATAAIVGTAVLVYANRPECSANPNAGGCGYGTKVVGTSVLAGGVVGLFVGALTW